MRIGYVCKYVPAEALEAMGAHMERIEPDESLVSFDAAESCMHANVCSFAKATFETVLSGNLDGIVLTTCCDSMRRLAEMCIRDRCLSVENHRNWNDGCRSFGRLHNGRHSSRSFRDIRVSEKGS